MSEETIKPARKTPAPMTAFIGNWDKDLAGTTSTFIVKAKCDSDDKSVREAVKELGFGTYDVWVGRVHSVSFEKVEKSAFIKG